uniref:Uncharacterized protein n=1 Tax=Rhodopseudomonas palustris (strain BisA53) TaxID=316055 RepID=Q07TS7_RHOP5
MVSCDMASPKKTDRAQRTGQFVIGRDRFEQISAVEGIKVTAAMKKREAEFDRDGLTAEQRRRSIIDAHRKS